MADSTPAELVYWDKFDRTRANAEKLRAMNLPSRRGVFAMMLITGIYLMFEVAFAARLLDVVGSTTDLHEIEQIEIAGRIISGIALTLVVWSAFAFPRMRRRRGRRVGKLFTLLLIGAACCAFSYHVQEAILNAISDNSTPAQRQAAATLTLVSSSVQSERAVLDGIDFSVIDRGSPEAKTFMALLPALALSVDRLEERTSDAVEDLLERQAERALGDPAVMYEEVYFPSMNALKTSYNEIYIEAASERREARAAIPGEQARLYRAYRNSLGRATPTTVRSADKPGVRRSVQDMGVPVSSTWELTDREGFHQAAEDRMLSEIDGPYEDAMQQAFGRILPDDLTARTFFDDAEVQAVWRDRMGHPEDIHLEVDMAPDAFKSGFYDVWVQHIVAERKPLYIADISLFEEGAEHHAAGVDAIRVAYVPLIAFGFSILGALVHTFKTMNFAAQAAIGVSSIWRLRFTKAVKLALAGLVLTAGVTMARDANPVTNSVLFVDLEHQTDEVAGPVLATAIRSIIQLQSHVYPVAEDIRSRALLGITYDFDPDSEVPAFEFLVKK